MRGEWTRDVLPEGTAVVVGVLSVARVSVLVGLGMSSASLVAAIVALNLLYRPDKPPCISPVRPLLSGCEVLAGGSVRSLKTVRSWDLEAAWWLARIGCIMAEEEGSFAIGGIRAAGGGVDVAD